MMREIYMVSILQLQKKGFNLPRNWQPLTVFSILYVMFLCSLERIGCYEWKETFASNQWHEFRLKAAVQDFYEESGPSAILVLVNETAWASCPPPRPPSWGLHPSLCWGDRGTNPLLVRRPWPRKAFSAINALAWEVSAALSILRLPLLVSKSTCEPMARQPSRFIPLINRPLNWSLTSLHTFPKLLLTPETLAPRCPYRFDFVFVSGHTDQEENPNNPKNLYYHTITLTAKSLFFYSIVRTTICFWLKYYSQRVFRSYKIIQNLFRLMEFHICFKISDRCPT